ncbi:MAG TPA: hypothetical protein EYH30_03560, partial [Anaerolineales bacterium]|nr:hypothetical protein [Anaerolineales bacterium]
MEGDRRLEQLYQLGLVVGATLDLTRETAAFMGWLVEAVEPRLAALFIAERSRRELWLVQVHGFDLPADSRLPLGLDPWRWLGEQGVAVPSERDPCRYVIPISVEQQLFGTLCLLSRCPPDRLAEEQRLVSTAASYLAPVLGNIWRYQALEQRMAEVERLNTTLTGLLEDLQVANRRLETTAARLEEANEELKAFAYSVSHDLRAPLRAIQGFARALLEDCADRLGPRGQDYAHRIVRAARRMDRLIQDLLAYSRVGRLEIRLRRVSLGQVVREVLAQLEAEIQRTGAQVVVEGPLPEVVAHRSVLVQVVENLLSNGIKFIAEGVRPRVRVWAEERGGRVRLWVEDNGIGIPPADQDRIFRVFERLHGVDTYPGTGVGLAIVKKG